MNLLKKVKELMPESKTVLSDPELIVINKRDYYTGESSPVDAYNSMFSGLSPTNSYQEYELMNNVVTLTNILKLEKKISIEIISINTEKIALYLYCNIFNSKKFKEINVFKKEKENNIIPKNEYSKIIYENFNKKNYGEEIIKGSTNIIFVDALNDNEYEKANIKFKDNKKQIIVILNGSNINAKEKNNPYAEENTKYIYSISGGIIGIKV